MPTNAKGPKRFRLTPRDIEREGIREMLTKGFKIARSSRELTCEDQALLRDATNFIYWEEPLIMSSNTDEKRHGWGPCYNFYIELESKMVFRITNFIELVDDWMEDERDTVHSYHMNEEEDRQNDFETRATIINTLRAWNASSRKWYQVYVRLRCQR